MGIEAEGLGFLYDVGIAFAPVDIDTANGFTGKRISMMPGRGVTFFFIGGVGGAEDLVFDFQQHTAYTGGTTKDLDADTTATGVAGSTGIDHYWIKAETALDGDEAWVKVTQTASSEVTVVGATYGTQQKIVAVEVYPGMLADGYTHVSATASITTSTSQLATGIYVVHNLRYPRRPDRLFNLLRPGAANA